MSCEVCQGFPGCPCCESEPRMTECTNCNGEGFTAYYNSDGEETTRKEWDSIPVDDRGEDTCNSCEGTGEVLYEYEPEYDHHYE